MNHQGKLMTVWMHIPHASIGRTLRRAFLCVMGIVVFGGLLACGGGSSSSSSADTDGDGLTDEEERVLGTRIDTEDTDRDELTDYEEVREYFTDPLNADSDDDGLIDGLEVDLLGTNPLKADSDDDTFDDKSELDSDTDPLNFYSNLTSLNALRFTMPVDLSVSDGHAYAPSVGLGPDGNPHVVYHDNTAGGMDIYYTYSKDYGATYSAPVNISNSAGISEFAKVAIDSAGNVYVVWKDNTDGNSNVFFSKRAKGDNAEFGQPMNISIDRLIVSTNPDVAIDSAGRVVVCWYQENQVVVIVSDSLDDAEKNIFDKYWGVAADEAVFRVSLALGDDNSIHVAFEKRLNGLTQIFYTRLVGDELSTPQQISKINLGGVSPRVDLDSLNNVYVVWSEFGIDDENEEIRIARSRDQGQSFQVLGSVSNSNGISVMPDLFISPEDIIYISWQDTTPGNFETFVTSSSDQGDHFSEGLNIAPSETGSLISTVAVNDKGQVFVAWDDNRFGPFEAVANRGEIGQPAVAEVTLSSQVFTPNGDGNNDLLEIAAFSTDPLMWVVEIWKVDESDRIVGLVDRLVSTYRSAADAGLTVDNYVTWDGLDPAGELEEGAYYVLVTGETFEGVAPIAKRIEFTLLTAQESDTPEILTFEVDEEVFAPDADGRSDTVRFSGNFNKELDWQLDIRDGNDLLVHTTSGQGQSIFASWDGADLNSNALGEGLYPVLLTVVDSNGNQVTSDLELTIDLTAPDVTDLDIPEEISLSGDDAVISLSVSEGSVVTVYVYQGESQLVKEIHRDSYEKGGAIMIIDRDDGSESPIEWDGTTGAAGSETDVEPGEYSFKIWVRDFAANRNVDYPIIKFITVTE